MATQKVKVDQPDGEVVVQHSVSGKDIVNTYKVSNGEISVKDEDVARVVAAVPGASVEASGGTQASK